MLQNKRTPDKNTQKNYGMSAQNFKNLPEKIEKTADITKEQLAFLLAKMCIRDSLGYTPV